MTNEDHHDRVTPVLPESQRWSALASAPVAAPTLPGQRRSRWRAVLAGSVAGGVLAASAAVPLTWRLTDADARFTGAAVDLAADDAGATTLPSSQTARPWGSGPSVDPYDDQLAPGFGGQSSTVTAPDMDATGAQSLGVVLIDTVTAGGEGAGTGLVLNASGMVVTNYHVIEGATSVSVTVATTGEQFEADVLGVDPQADVAVLQLQDAAGLDVVQLDADGGTTVNDAVTAVGNANGQGFLSASTGMVTALEESITTAAEGSVASEDLSGLIETDTHVVGGYSGGAMLDVEGEVVGITTAASNGSAQIESYAVPIEDALAVVDEVTAGDEAGSVRIGPAAYLGVVVDDALQVAEVEAGSAADVAGIEAGATVRAVNGILVDDLEALAAVLADLEPGFETTVRWVVGDGTVHRSSVALGASTVA